MEEDPALDMARLVEIQHVGKELYEKAQTQFHEGERIYRLALGTYVTEDVWNAAWRDCPSGWPEAWQLISNGYVEASDLLGDSERIAQCHDRLRPISEALSLDWNDGLKDALAPQPIGRTMLDAIDIAANELDGRVREEFPSGAPVFRINDEGDYVSEKDWNEVWALHPGWWEEAWMLADNGTYRSEEVAGMTVGEIARAYSDPEYCPEIAFYTEAE